MARQQTSAFGDLLKRYRLAAGLSQGALAHRARVSVHAIRNLERGLHHAPYRQTVLQLADALQLEAPNRSTLEAAAQGPPTSTAQNDPDRDRAQRDSMLLMSKLAIPTGRSDLAVRPRLMERLHLSRQCKLTVIAAPAGFGKTTLLTQWHMVGDGAKAPVAWVSLDAADNDPARFWRYTITALQRVHPDGAAPVLSRLQPPRSPQMLPIEALLTALLHALSALPVESILVFDDYHLIDEPTIHQAVSFLLDHLPSHVHVVISTRDDPPLPLPRLRMRGDLLELRAEDLRFTTKETALLLNEMMSLQLSEEDLRTLEARTEGWIAGLQLAALAMRDRDDPGTFISAFAGSNRYVTDYLMDEVLLRQPQATQLFLLQTSILDRMCASVCDAVMGWETGSQSVLTGLERANLFVVPLDEERQWYRYHHLFAEVLRHRLSHLNQALVPELHSRASTWFQEQGSIAEAIRHALEASDFQRAEKLIEESGLPIMLQGQVQTVLAWLNALPDELVRSSAPVCIIHAVALMFIGQMDASEARLADAERCVEAGMLGEEVDSVLGTASVIRANIAQFKGDVGAFVALSRQALDLLPETDTMVRAVAEGGEACEYLVSGEVTAIRERRLTTALAAARSSGDVMASLTGLTHIARFHVMQGRLRQAAATYEEIPRLSPESHDLYMLAGSAAYSFGLGDVLREQNDLETAEQYLRRGINLVRGVPRVNAEHVALGYAALASLYQAHGEYETALATLEDFVQLATERNFVAPLILRTAALAARVELSRGNLARVSHWVEASGLDANDESGFPQEVEYLTLARILIARGSTNPLERATASLQRASRLLDRLLLGAETTERMGSVIEIQILRALALRASGEIDDAMQTLERALALAEPEGYVRIFLDEGAPLASLLSEWRREHACDDGHDPLQRTLLVYGQHLLAVFEKGSAAETKAASDRRSEGTVDQVLNPLTDRELAVLRLLTAGLTNPEIGAELYISINTVKWYVKIIYSKLGAQSRTGAVARARDLHLVPA